MNKNIPDANQTGHSDKKIQTLILQHIRATNKSQKNRRRQNNQQPTEHYVPEDTRIPTGFLGKVVGNGEEHKRK
ncbi:MAG: hypothetical protein ACM3UN_02760 [Bacillota bacterium]